MRCCTLACYQSRRVDYNSISAQDLNRCKMPYSEYWQPNRITTDITFLKSLEQRTRNGAIYNQWAARPNDSNIVLMADLPNDTTKAYIDNLIRNGVTSTTQDSYTQQVDPRSIKRSLGIGIRPWLIALYSTRPSLAQIVGSRARR